MSKIACGTLCFSRLSFSKACAEIASLGFDAIDLAVMQNWAHFNPSDLVENLEDAIDSAQSTLEELGLEVVAFNASAGASEVGPETERFDAICRFARALGAPVVCYVAPVAAVGMDRALRRYERLRDIALEHGILLAVEAHARTMLEIPERAVAFCEALEYVYLTLDPSHLYAGENQGAPFDILYPYVRHTHWRDGGDAWERCQLDVGTGLVDFDGIIEGLRNEDYGGAYAVEYIDTFPNGGRRNILAMKRVLEGYVSD